jgi:uncharacterized protein
VTSIPSEWERLEAPLVTLEPALMAFAAGHQLTIRRNFQGRPERSLVQVGEVMRLIQVYLDDPARLTFNIWLCASQDRAGARYQKSDYLARGVTAADLVAGLDHWLEQGYAALQGWQTEDLSLGAALAQPPQSYGSVAGPYGGMPGGAYLGAYGGPPGGPYGGAHAAQYQPVAAHAPASRPKAPWTARDVWVGVAVLAVIMGAAYGAAYLLRALSVRPNIDIWVSVTANLMELLLLLPVWWFVLHKRHASITTLGLRKFKLWSIPAGLGFLFAYYIFTAIYAGILSRFGLHLRGDPSPVLERLATPWPVFFSIAIVAPVVEEIFFRGFIFGGLRTRFRWQWAAVISAAIFAGAHLELTFFLPAFFLGFLLAFLYEESNSIWPGMIVHMLLNSLAVLGMYLTM